MRCQHRFWSLVTHPLLLIVAALVVLALVTVCLFPKLITGDYLQVTIVSIQVNGKGHAEILWKDKHSSGTGIGGGTYINGVGPPSVQSGGGGLAGWPVDCAGNYRFSLNPHRENLDRATLMKRIKVVEGQTYVVRTVKPLTLFQFTEANGTVYEGRLEVP